MNKKETIKKAFQQIFKGDPVIVRSPGRINIIGEHTDYNDGLVMPAAIEKAAYVAMSLRNDDEIHLVALDIHKKCLINIADLKPISNEQWANYIVGVVAQFIKMGIVVSGFNAVLTSDVPIGAGLSSSAAITCATVFGLNELLNTKLGRISMAQMAQKAEHEYAGVMCGIMDQFASIMGKKDCVIQLDCRSLEYHYMPFQLEGYKILLLNTNVKHSLASSEYNIRRNECEQAVRWIQQSVFSVKSLRDANEEMLNKYVFPKNELIGKRSRFVVQEIDRVLIASEDLEKADLYALGKKMYQTHFGLREMYDVSCQELDWLVHYVQNNGAVIGARMMGGGFGGCTINLVKEDAVAPLLTQIIPAYEKVMNLPLTYYIVSIQNGTEIL